MLATTSSSEIEEWIVELGILRPEEERQAYEEAERKAKGSSDGVKPLTRADIAEAEAINQAARERNALRT